MSNICLPLKRQFSGTSDNGITFCWLKRNAGSALSPAVTKAMRIVYLPSALCVDSKSWERVYLERQESRQEFEGWMNPSEGELFANKNPRRVVVDLLLDFPKASDNGKTLAWMLETFGGKTGHEILRAVQMVYLPSALAAFQEHRGRIDFEVRRSRMLFSDKRASDELPTARELLPFSTNGKPREITVLAAATPTREEVEDSPESSPKGDLILSDGFPDLDLDAIYNDD